MHLSSHEASRGNEAFFNMCIHDACIDQAPPESRILLQRRPPPLACDLDNLMRVLGNYVKCAIQKPHLCFVHLIVSAYNMLPISGVTSELEHP
jgi:hypothetical protein